MSARRSNLGARLAALEHQLQQSRPAAAPPVRVHLPIKDGDDRAPGTEVWPGGATVVWYRAEHPTGTGEPT